MMLGEGNVSSLSIHRESHARYSTLQMEETETRSSKQHSADAHVQANAHTIRMEHTLSRSNEQQHVVRNSARSIKINSAICCTHAMV